VTEMCPPPPQQPRGGGQSPGLARCPPHTGRVGIPAWPRPQGPRCSSAAQNKAPKPPGTLHATSALAQARAPPEPQDAKPAVLPPPRLHRDGASGLGSTRRCTLPQDPPSGLRGWDLCVHHIPGCLSVPTSESCCRHTALPSPRGHPGSAPPKGTRGHRPAPRQASLPWCPRGLQGVPQEHWPAEQPPPPTLVCSFLLQAPLHGPTPTMSKDPALPAFPGALLSSGCPPGEAGTARAALGPRTTGTEWGPPPTMGAPRPGGRTHP